MSLSRVLVGVDQSPESLVALEWARSFAEEAEAEVHVAYAWFRRGQLDHSHPHTADPVDLEAAIRARLEEVCEHTATSNVPIVAHALRGAPAHALEVTAERLDAELLVVGASSRSLASRVFRSSVSRSLMTRPQRPLALVPTGSRICPWNEGTIVVGLDGSASSARAARWVAEVAEPSGANVIGVHAFEPSLTDLNHDDERHLFEEATTRLRHEWCGVWRDNDVQHELRAVPAEPSAAMREVAESVSATCIVIGSSERTSLSCRLFGGVSQRIGRDPVAPVIIVPSPRDRVTW